MNEDAPHDALDEEVLGGSDHDARVGGVLDELLVQFQEIFQSVV